MKLIDFVAKQRGRRVLNATTIPADSRCCVICALPSHGSRRGLNAVMTLRSAVTGVRMAMCAHHGETRCVAAGRATATKQPA